MRQKTVGLPLMWLREKRLDWCRLEASLEGVDLDCSTLEECFGVGPEA